MSDKVRFTKEGLKAIRWNSTIQEYEEDPRSGSWLSRLRVATTIDLGVTLGDIFDAVEKHPELKNLIGPYSWCNVDAFHKEAKRDPLEKASDLKYLQLSCFFEFDEGMHWQFNGVGTDEEETTYAIEFTPVNEMVHLEVRLSNKCTILKDYKSTGTCEIYASLLDILDAIYFEISFTGNPEERDQMSAELRETVKQIREGTVDTVPWEDIKDKPTIQ